MGNRPLFLSIANNSKKKVREAGAPDAISLGGLGRRHGRPKRRRRAETNTGQTRDAIGWEARWQPGREAWLSQLRLTL